MTVIADENGKLLAHPVATKAVQVINGRLQATDWTDVDEPQIVAAVHRRAAGSPDRFNFTLGPNTSRCSASARRVQGRPGRSWS